MRLRIAERLWLRPDQMPEAHWQALCEWALERFVLDNPAYWHAREQRRPCKHLPRQFALAVLGQDDAGPLLELPRGAGRELRRWLAAQCPQEAIDIDDARAAPPCGPLQLAPVLRDYQQDAVMRAAMQREGVLVSPTGSGKTVMAMGLIARLGVRALIIVHTRTLLDQTCETVRRCLGIEPGRLGGGVDTDGDVVVATVQSLVRRPQDALRGRFGLVLLDEAHHCPASTFTDVLQRLDCRYRIGLTATPERADKLHPLLFATIGPELVRLRPTALLREGALVAANIIPVWTSFAAQAGTERAELVSQLCAQDQRNREVLGVIQATAGHHALVLSERVQHCEWLAEQLARRGVVAELLVGRMPPEARDAALTRFQAARRAVLVATSTLVGEGFDCPALDTLYLTVPTGNWTRTTQALGRVLRPTAGKSAANVYDFVDKNTPGMELAFRRRLQVYRRHGTALQAPLDAAALALRGA